jgi:hypothetical protein
MLFGMNPNLSYWMRRRGSAGTIIPFMGLCMSTISWFMMSVNIHARRQSPQKWHLLILFTIGEAISVGFISSLY